MGHAVDFKPAPRLLHRVAVLDAVNRHFLGFCFGHPPLLCCRLWTLLHKSAGLWLPVRNLTPTESSKQLCDILHWPEELHRLVWKRQETLTFIKAAGSIVFGVDDDGKRSNFTTTGSVERISKQETPEAPPLTTVV